MAKKKVNNHIQIEITSKELREFVEFAEDAENYALPTDAQTRDDINIKIYNGDHWDVWNEYKTRWGFPETDQLERRAIKRFRMQGNLSKQALDKQVSYLTGSTPDFTVRAVTHQSDDILAAMLDKNILKAVWRRKNVPAMQLRILTVMGLVDKAFWHVYWDGSAGDFVKGAFQGDIGYKILYPNEVFPEPGVTYLEESKRVVLKRAFPISVVTRFGLQPEDLKNTKPTTNMPESHTSYRYRVWGDIGPFSAHQKFIVLYDIYEKPTKEYPEGRHIVWCEPADDNKTPDILYSRPLPVNYRWGFPIVEFHERKVESDYIGKTCMEDAIPSQMMYNLLKSVSLEVLVKLIPRYFIPAGSLLPQTLQKNHPQVLSSVPGDCTPFDPSGGGKPVIDKGATPSPVLLSFMENEKNSIWESFHVTDIKPFISRSNITLGAIRHAVEQDMSVLKKVYGDMVTTAMSKVAALTLAIYQERAASERLWGENIDFYKSQVIRFKGADIKFTDVSIEPESIIGSPAVIVEDQLQRDIATGVINPRTPEGRREIRLRTKTLAPHVLSPNEKQELRADDENQLMLRIALEDSKVKPSDLWVHWVDDPNIHAAVHGPFWISPQVLALPEAQYKVFERLMMRHLLEHFPDLARKIQAQMKLVEQQLDARIPFTPDEWKQLLEALKQTNINIRMMFEEHIRAAAEGYRTREIQELMEQGKVTAATNPYPQQLTGMGAMPQQQGQGVDPALLQMLQSLQQGGISE